MKPLPQIPGYVFKFYCQKVLPAVYDDSLSYYEVLCKLTAKLNELITADMAQNDAIKELQNYFSSLDIEPAVLAGLQTMAEQGTLTTILTSYVALAKSFAFQTLADLKAAQNLSAGIICQTIGKTNYKTGDGSFYYVREKTPEDIPDDDLIVAFAHTYNPVIIAEKIPDPVANNLADLTTTVNGHTGDIQTINNKFTNDIGSLTNLETPTKTDIVSAINSGYNANVGDISDINTSLTGVRDDMGVIANLETTNKTNLVSAINSILTTTWGVDQGGTGGTTKPTARQNLGLFKYKHQYSRSTDMNNNWTHYDVGLERIDYIELFYAYNPPGTQDYFDCSTVIKFKDSGVVTHLTYVYPHTSSGHRIIDLASTEYQIDYDPTNGGTITITTGTRLITTIDNSSLSTSQSEYNQFNLYRIILYQYD